MAELHDAVGGLAEEAEGEEDADDDLGGGKVVDGQALEVDD